MWKPCIFGYWGVKSITIKQIIPSGCTEKIFSLDPNELRHLSEWEKDQLAKNEFIWYERKDQSMSESGSWYESKI